MPLSSSGTAATSLIYEDLPRYDTKLKVLLWGILALTLIPGFILLAVDIVGAWLMFGVTVFDALLLGAIVPRRFQIFEDRVRIVLGGPFTLNIPLSDVNEARLVSGSNALIYWGLRFATSSTGVVEIVREKGLGVIISPLNSEMFLEQLNRAIGTASDSN